MTLEELKTCKIGLTHSGSFHADDVFSAAFLHLIVPDIQIKRVQEVPEDFSGIVFDIGFGEFDHHMNDNEKRSDGVPYASFGKLWRAFAPELYCESIYQRIDKSFIKGLDLSDNTGKYDSLCSAIESLNPIDRDATGDKEFLEAVEFAQKILDQKIQKQIRNLEEETYVMDVYQSMEDKRIVILPKYASFHDVLPDTEAVYVIYPSRRGGYSAQGVTKNADTIELKKDFPKDWVEKLPDYLTFCHTSRFLISANTLEDVIKACIEALEED